MPKNKPTIQDMVNRIVWSQDKNLYSIVVIDRLAPGGKRVISGKCIKKISRGFMIVSCQGLEDSMIPLHRVIEIRKNNTILWSRYS